MQVDIPAFIYHGLLGPREEEGHIDISERRYYLPASTFGAHLDFLRSSGIQALSLARWLSTAATGRPTVLLTFDDGHRSNYDIVWPMLAERGFSATFFIVASWMDRPDRIGKAQLRELHQAGITIGSHGLTHTRMNQLGRAELDRELKKSKALIEDALGAPVASLALPGGSMGPSLAEQAAKAGYEHVLTSRPGWARHGFLINRLSVTVATRQSIFERLALHNRKQLATTRAAYAIRMVGKRLIGIEAYERFYALRVGSSAPSKPGT